MIGKFLRRVSAGLGLRRRPAAASTTKTEPFQTAPSALQPSKAPAAKAMEPPPPMAGKTRFVDLDLPMEIQRAVVDLGYRYCTPIQAEILPVLLAGRNAAGQSQTGTGKTAAFLLALFAGFLRQRDDKTRPPGTPLALVLAPTRELAIQIRKEADSLATYTGIVTTAVFGGMDYDKQRRALVSGRTDLLVATPGRLLDFMGSGTIRLDRVETLVIDEADRMMDMGFIPDVSRIIRRLPPRNRRRTWLFSATLSPEVMRLASRWMDNPQRVEIQPEKVTVDTIEQKVYIVPAPKKMALLMHILAQPEAARVIVFANRRDTAERLVESLRRRGLNVALLSGAVSQEKRLRTLESFRAGRIPIVVATDVAGRGLHIDNVTHVINYNLPEDPEDYVHRIGRTGRVGASGVSVAFACEDESFSLPEIEKFIGRPLVYEQPPDEWMLQPDAPVQKKSIRPVSRSRRPAGPRRSPARRPGRHSRCHGTA